MKDAIILSFVTSAISFAVAETKLLRPIREWLNGKSSFFGEMMSCGYCVGHWVALALVIIYRPRLLHSWPLLDYPLTALAIAWLGGVQWALMCLLIEKAGK